MTSPFIQKMQSSMGKSGNSILESIAPAKPAEESVAAVAPAPINENACVLLPIPSQPKSGKDIQVPLYDEQTHEVKRLGVRLSAAPDNVPCAYFHKNKRLNMSAMLMFELDDQGKAQLIPYNTKNKEKQEKMKAAADAVRTAFSVHRADPDLTHVKLLTAAGLYDEKTIGITYQLYEKTINELLGAGTPAAVKRTRNKPALPPAEEQEEDEDDEYISGTTRSKKQKTSHPVEDAEEDDLDPELLAAVADLEHEEEEEDDLPPLHLMIEPKVLNQKTNVSNFDPKFVRTKLFSILQNCNQNDLSLWDALQSESLDAYFIHKVDDEIRQKKSQSSRDYWMALLFATMRHHAGKPDPVLWELTGKILG